jgi:hypothetical protein
MTNNGDNKGQQVRVLLDLGYSEPMLASEIVKQYPVTQVQLATPLVVDRFDSLICPNRGPTYIDPLNLNLHHYSSKVSFEI